jgi:hypothetical protein
MILDSWLLGSLEMTINQNKHLCTITVVDIDAVVTVVAVVDVLKSGMVIETWLAGVDFWGSWRKSYWTCLIHFKFCFEECDA